MPENPELRVMTGNAHPELAESIVHNLGVKLVEATVDHFPDDETRIKIKDGVRDNDVFVIQPTGPPANQNIMESLLIIDALRRASAGRITAVIPYFGYARQDRKDASRVPISAKLVANLYASAGANRLLAVDLHSAQIQGFSDLPFDHLYAVGAIVDEIKNELDNPVVVAPDVGAGKMARGYANRLQTDWAMFDKERQDPFNTKIAAVIGQDVCGRDVLIVDDMATTAGSLINAAEALKVAGAKLIAAAVTHGVFSPEAKVNLEMSDALQRLYTTDSLPARLRSDKVRRITIAPLLAQAIANIHEGKSISSLFK